MSTYYTDTEAHQNFFKLLDEARVQQEVFIKRQNGELFAIRVIPKKGAAYHLPNIDLGFSREEILSYIREGRERNFE